MTQTDEARARTVIDNAFTLNLRKQDGVAALYQSIVHACAESRREGAKQMREVAAAIADENAEWDSKRAILSLPLPGDLT